MKWLDTTALPDHDQRCNPIETVGQVIGTSGTIPYVHLQLEMSKRLHANGCPTLVANDGDNQAEVDALTKLCNEYNVEFICWKALGHSHGDLKIFIEGMRWAKRIGIDVFAKFSRRFVPLIPWRHGLQYLLSNHTDTPFFTRRHMDRPDGMFRTDAIACRLRLIDNQRVWDILNETVASERTTCVEMMFETFASVNGGWCPWDLLGPNFYKPWTHAMQWRGLLPYHYGDLSRQLGLPYTDLDFLAGSAMKFMPADSPNLKEIKPPPVAAWTKAEILQMDGKSPFTSPDAPPVETPSELPPQT